jgi:formate--tetrahydrofolate ligase
VASLEVKVRALATSLFGAGGVSFAEPARAALARFQEKGFGRLPICVAKTPLSFSGSPHLLNAPSGFDLAVSDARLYAGAGFVTVLVGEISSMPALPTRPRGEKIEVTAAGEIAGLL